MAFLAKVTPWGTHCKRTKKDSALLLLWILTESVQLKGVRIWIFFMSIEVRCNCGHQLLGKTCEARLGSHPQFCCLSSCNFPYQDITITTQFFRLLFRLYTGESRLTSGSSVGVRKELGSIVRKGQWEAGDLAIPDAHLWTDASKGTEGWLCTSQGSAPFRVEKKDVGRDKNNIFKECPQQSSSLLMAVLCKYFCA